MCYLAPPVDNAQVYGLSIGQIPLTSVIMKIRKWDDNGALHTSPNWCKQRTIRLTSVCTKIEKGDVTNLLKLQTTTSTLKSAVQNRIDVSPKEQSWETEFSFEQLFQYVFELYSYLIVAPLIETHLQCWLWIYSLVFGHTYIHLYKYL